MTDYRSATARCTAMRPILLLLAACGSSGPVATRAPGPVASARRPPAIFAELVQPHRSWKLPAEVVSVHGGDTTRTKGEVTCTTDATVVGDGWRVELACEGMALAARLTETYEITGAGMWVAPTGGDDKRSAAQRFRLAATPVAYEHRDEHDEPDFPNGSLITAAPRNGAWCISDDYWGGDEGGTTLCFEAGKGITGAAAFFSGGFTDDLYVGDVKRD